MTKTKRDTDRDRRRIQREGMMAAWQGVEAGDPIGHGNPVVYAWLRQHDALMRTGLGHAMLTFVVWQIFRDSLHDPAKRQQAHADLWLWVEIREEDEVQTWYLRRALTDPSLGTLDPTQARRTLAQYMERLLDELGQIVDGPTLAQALAQRRGARIGPT